MTARAEARPPEELLQRHRAFWNRRAVDRPLVRIDTIGTRIDFASVRAIYGKEAGRAISPAEADPERFLAGVAWEDVVPPGEADLFDVLPPYVRIPWLEAICGCRVLPHPDSDSIWSDQPDPPPFEPRTVDPDPAWLGALRRQITRLAEDDSLPCPTAQTILRGPGDVAEALLGGESLCLAMMDEADWLAPFLAACTDAFIAAAHVQLDAIPPLWGGFFNFFGFWSPAPCVRIQEDVQRILSPEHYRHWLRPCLERIVRAFPTSMFHIHSGSLHMIDEVTTVPGLGALEVAVDEPPYAPPITESLDDLRRVQTRVPLFLEGTFSPREVEALVAGLDPAGLALRSASWVRREDK